MAHNDDIPILTDVSSIYLNDVAEQAKRYQEISSHFKKLFGCLPEAFVRAPGRVNIIGEHIDYEGYSVLPMAIRNDIVIAVATTDAAGDTFTVANTDANFCERKLAIDPSTPIDRSHHDWSHYFLCGYKGVFDAIRNHKDYQDVVPKRMMALVDGSIPAGAGLSSSSAFVVASALATCVSNGFRFNRTELAELSCVAEHYIGTMGGGMDQAISCLGEHGIARHIMFNPLRTEPVYIPKNGVVVIANSMTVAEKAVDAATHFNKRVVECLLASKLIAKKVGLSNWRDIGTLRQLQDACHDFPGGNSLKNMVALVAKELDPVAYSTQQLETLFGYPLTSVHPGQLRAAMRDVLLTAREYKLFQRATHGYTEASRVVDFHELCSTPACSTEDEDAMLNQLGALMDQSQASCRDLYECSCTELNQLISVCKEAGALGSRLTGAGWGGSVVCLVRENEVERFLKRVKNLFYKDRDDVDKLLFASKPGMGAAIYSLRN